MSSTIVVKRSESGKGGYFAAVQGSEFRKFYNNSMRDRFSDSWHRKKQLFFS